MTIYQDPSDDTLVFSAEESKSYHLSEPAKKVHSHATPSNPVWITFNGEWILDNGDW